KSTEISIKLLSKSVHRFANRLTELKPLPDSLIQEHAPDFSFHDPAIDVWTKVFELNITGARKGPSLEWDLESYSTVMQIPPQPVNPNLAPTRLLRVTAVVFRNVDNRARLYPMPTDILVFVIEGQRLDEVRFQLKNADKSLTHSQ